MVAGPRRVRVSEAQLPNAWLVIFCDIDRRLYGCDSVDGEWIAAKKDWQQAEKRYKAQEERASTMNSARSSHDIPSADQSKPGVPADASGHYQPEMDEMRCILYIHGGAHCFASPKLVSEARYRRLLLRKC